MFTNLNQDLIKKAKNITHVFTDIDGVLTDGQIYLTNLGDEFKSFNVKDGFGIRQLLKNNIKIIVITAKESKLLTKRMNDLGVKDVHQNIKDKLTLFKKISQTEKILAQNSLYIGDDVLDLKVLKQVSFAVCPKDAHFSVQQYCDYITPEKGGKGAFRHISDLILFSKNLL